MSLFSELKRRNVFKVAGAYLVVAWVVIQVADVVAPQLSLPEWAPRFVTLLVLLGFPLALVLAWIFDITPEGIRAEATSGSKRVFVVGTVVAVAVLGWYVPRLTQGSRAAEDARSIAVLPFVNMSGDPEQEYFSDGISEEILNVLARSPELRVAARTSSFAFKGQNMDVPDIARALEVGMVLEGSVRQQGERVRITAQLIDAESGFHVWSETYDRELKDIFAVQDEIAGAIGAELKIRVGGDRPTGSDHAATVDPEAYDLYLRGLALWQTRSDNNLLDALDLLERATALDPGFARAYVGLALVYSVIPDYTTQVSYEDAFALGRDAAERALALDPGLPEAFASLGNIAFSAGRKATGLALLERAILLNPSFASARQWLGMNLMTVGRLEEGLASLERAHELDPQSSIVADNYAIALLVAERYPQAIEVCEATLEAQTEGWLCTTGDTMARLHESGLAGARDAMLKWATRAGPGPLRQAEALLAALEGRGDRRAIARELAALPIRSGTDADAGVLFSLQDTPSLLMLLGETELAMDYLERAVAVRYGAPEWGMALPWMDPVRCEPRFRDFAEQLGMVDPRYEKVCGGAKAP
ncbi:MAG TPA: tetratricopeptide repeat protein [Longimicrobiales bacterium]|nr:tetratricopeptide repeat protein [Longimicrobiales bacterium]